jgi:hypothetical protein
MILAAAIALILATPMEINNGPPPLRYRGDGQASVSFMHDVSRLCTLINPKLPPGYAYEACMDGNHLNLPNPCAPRFAGETYAHIACHELGHINGWSRLHGK